MLGSEVSYIVVISVYFALHKHALCTHCTFHTHASRSDSYRTPGGRLAISMLAAADPARPARATTNPHSHFTRQAEQPQTTIDALSMALAQGSAL